jgi:hypothetical protein
MSERDLDFDLHNAIQDLIGEGLLEENALAHGVARKVIHDGYNSLTTTQRTLYDDVVAPALKKRGEKIEHNQIKESSKQGNRPLNKQALPAHIGSKMNALGFSADFTSAGIETWKKQSANGHTTIGAHDTDAEPLFPDNNLHAALDAKVWTVKYYSSDLTLRGAKKDLTLDEAIARGASYESGPSRPVGGVLL